MRLIFILLILLITSCGSDKVEETDNQVSIDKPHADYRRIYEFIAGKGFVYEEANEIGFENIKRGERELEGHRPTVTLEDNGHKIVLKFDKHPHKKSHFWSWVEVVDFNGQLVYENVPEPEEDSEKFEYTVFSETPFRRRVRIRCYCQVHGEFIDYADIPEFKNETILDRKGPEK
jgi:desulfoferrodoxin (superoxide reductase-like protein)